MCKYAKKPVDLTVFTVKPTGFLWWGQIPVVNPFGTQALAGYSATMRVENVFSLIFVSIGNAVSPYVSQNLGAKKIKRIKKGYRAALVLDVCFAIIAFIVIETLHTQISSLFLGKDGTALAYQVSGGYMLR